VPLACVGRCNSPGLETRSARERCSGRRCRSGRVWCPSSAARYRPARVLRCRPIRRDALCRAEAWDCAGPAGSVNSSAVWDGGVCVQTTSSDIRRGEFVAEEQRSSAARCAAPPSPDPSGWDAGAVRLLGLLPWCCCGGWKEGATGVKRCRGCLVFWAGEGSPRAAGGAGTPRQYPSGARRSAARRGVSRCLPRTEAARRQAGRECLLTLASGRTRGVVREIFMSCETSITPHFYEISSCSLNCLVKPPLARRSAKAQPSLKAGGMRV